MMSGMSQMIEHGQRTRPMKMTRWQHREGKRETRRRVLRRPRSPKRTDGSPRRRNEKFVGPAREVKAAAAERGSRTEVNERETVSRGPSGPFQAGWICAWWSTGDATARWTSMRGPGESCPSCLLSIRPTRARDSEAIRRGWPKILTE